MVSQEHKVRNENENVYRDRLTAILYRSLTPENIDSYADKALDELIELIEEVVQTVGHEPENGFASKKDQETAAFRQFGLGDVESVLDHIADLANEIHALDDAIGRATTNNRVITPPDPRQKPMIIPAGGTYQ